MKALVDARVEINPAIASPLDDVEDAADDDSGVGHEERAGLGIDLEAELAFHFLEHGIYRFRDRAETLFLIDQVRGKAASDVDEPKVQAGFPAFRRDPPALLDGCLPCPRIAVVPAHMEGKAGRLEAKGSRVSHERHDFFFRRAELARKFPRSALVGDIEPGINASGRRVCGDPFESALRIEHIGLDTEAVGLLDFALDLDRISENDALGNDARRSDQFALAVGGGFERNSFPCEKMKDLGMVVRLDGIIYLVDGKRLEEEFEVAFLSVISG